MRGRKARGNSRKAPIRAMRLARTLVALRAWIDWKNCGVRRAILIAQSRPLINSYRLKSTAGIYGQRSPEQMAASSI
jgi:hypothetical protein